MNVDRLLKSPASQRGRDFGIILAYFRDEGYTVEWRVVNAADYGYQQRRRRTFIFAYKNEETKYAKDITSAIKYVSEFGDKMHRGSIPNQKLYYTYPDITHSDESHGKLPNELRQTWQYLKGAKKLPRKAANGHEYIFSEGAIPMIDTFDKPARTMLTSEGFFSRITHIVKDKATGRIRLLTAEETERIQGFPTGHTQFCMVGDEVVEMPTNKRRFMMGNALVVNLIRDMEKTLDEIFTREE